MARARADVEIERGIDMNLSSSTAVSERETDLLALFHLPGNARMFSVF